jgi:aryl-alcohol dehydrogenase-like predicted oxidoreductase
MGDSTQPAGGARRMGRTDLVVSRLGYGAMELSGPPRARAISEADAIRFVHAAIDRGVTYFDTSIDYGLSERVLGKALEGRRHEIILASKCACQVGLEDPGEHGESHTYTAQNVTAGVEQSLRRLKTDHLDVVQVHGNPTRRELEEGGVLRALEDLKQRGAIRWAGLSSRLPLLAEFVAVDSLDVFQVPYSALQRTNEDVVADLARAGKAIVARGVTGRGAPGKNWATRPIGTAEGEVRDLWKAAALDDILDGMSPIEFMIRFVLSNENIAVALVATTDLAHLSSDVDYANKGPLDAARLQEARRRIDAAGGGAGRGKYKGGGPTPVV